MSIGSGQPDEHTELCETIHGLLKQAADLSMYPTQARLIGALQEAEDAAHAMCPEPQINRVGV
jgi:hypothetical protein